MLPVGDGQVDQRAEHRLGHRERRRRVVATVAVEIALVDHAGRAAARRSPACRSRRSQALERMPGQRPAAKALAQRAARPVPRAYRARRARRGPRVVESGTGRRRRTSCRASARARHRPAGRSASASAECGQQQHQHGRRRPRRRVVLQMAVRVKGPLATLPSMKSIVILISGRGSNMEAIVQRCAAEGLAGARGGGDQQPRRCGRAAVRGSARHRHRGGGAQGLRLARGLRRRAGRGHRRLRARPGGAGRLHAHPGRALRAPLRRPHAQHPPVAAADVPGAAHAPARHRRRLQAGRGHGAFRHRRNWTTGRSCCSRWCRCSPATMPTRWPRACWPPNTASIRRRCAGSSRASCASSAASCGMLGGEPQLLACLHGEGGTG